MRTKKIIVFSVIVTLLSIITQILLTEFYSSFQTCDSFECISRRLRTIYLRYGVAYSTFSLIFGVFLFRNKMTGFSIKRLISTMLIVFLIGAILFICLNYYQGNWSFIPMPSWIFAAFLEYLFALVFKISAPVHFSIFSSSLIYYLMTRQRNKRIENRK